MYNLILDTIARPVNADELFINIGAGGGFWIYSCFTADGVSDIENPLLTYKKYIPNSYKGSYEGVLCIYL